MSAETNLRALPEEVRLLVQHLTEFIRDQREPVAQLIHTSGNIEDECAQLRHNQEPQIFDDADRSGGCSEDANVPKSWEDLEIDDRSEVGANGTCGEVGDVMPPLCDDESDDDEYLAGPAPPSNVCQKRWCLETLCCVCSAWSPNSEKLCSEWGLLSHHGLGRLWESDFSKSTGSRWAQVPHTVRQNFARKVTPCVAQMLDSTCFGRRSLRLNGGWESFLVKDLQVRCSLFATPFTTPTAMFHFPQDCPEFFRSHGSDLQSMIMKTIATNQKWASFFIRTDVYTPPDAQCFDTLDSWIRSDSRCRFIILNDRSAASSWSGWIESWLQAGRAHLLCEIPKLKMRSYQDGGEKWDWCVVDSGVSSIGIDLPHSVIGRVLHSLCKRARGRVLEFPGETSESQPHGELPRGSDPSRCTSIDREPPSPEILAHDDFRERWNELA